jgi:hypothetical protein
LAGMHKRVACLLKVLITIVSCSYLAAANLKL